MVYLLKIQAETNGSFKTLKELLKLQRTKFWDVPLSWYQKFFHERKALKFSFKNGGVYKFCQLGSPGSVAIVYNFFVTYPIPSLECFFFLEEIGVIWILNHSTLFKLLAVWGNLYHIDTLSPNYLLFHLSSC